MRVSFEPDDIQVIAEVVARRLSPMFEKVLEATKSPISSVTKLLPISEPEISRSLKSTGDIIRRKELCKITGVSMTTLWRWEREGSFPARIRLSTHSVGWRRSDIETWLETRPKV
jgi:prophage regulatory protein